MYYVLNDVPESLSGKLNSCFSGSAWKNDVDDFKSHRPN
jgi:hypothetical protein